MSKIVPKDTGHLTFGQRSDRHFVRVPCRNRHHIFSKRRAEALIFSHSRRSLVRAGDSTEIHHPSAKADPLAFGNIKTKFNMLQTKSFRILCGEPKFLVQRRLGVWRRQGEKPSRSGRLGWENLVPDLEPMDRKIVFGLEPQPDLAAFNTKHTHLDVYLALRRSADHHGFLASSR